MAALLTAVRAVIQMATSGTHEVIKKLNQNMATDRYFVAKWMKEVGDYRFGTNVMLYIVVAIVTWITYTVIVIDE